MFLATMCLNVFTNPNQRSMKIGSLLNPSEETASTVTTGHHASPVVTPMLSPRPRYVPGRHYPSHSGASSGSETRSLEKTYGSQAIRCQGDAAVWPSSACVFAQTWLPSNISSASLVSPNGTLCHTQTGRCRPARQKYKEEEMFFIWYYRVDLGLDWRAVLDCFNQQFPGRPRSGFHGMQRVLYRFIKEKRCPSFRTQNSILDQYAQNEHYSVKKYERAARFGVIACTANVWYPWMRESWHDRAAWHGREN